MIILLAMINRIACIIVFFSLSLQVHGNELIAIDNGLYRSLSRLQFQGDLSE